MSADFPSLLIGHIHKRKIVTFRKHPHTWQVSFADHRSQVIVFLTLKNFCLGLIRPN